MSKLFSPLTLRGTTFPNRVWLSPMCQYSAVDGVPNDWHLMHLGARAAGGFGLILSEATAVVPEGRISPQDVGLWNDEQADAWRRITDFAHDRGALIGVQLAHAGRKASVYRPWGESHGTVPEAEGGWRTLGPSAEAFPGYTAPAEMTRDQIGQAVEAFAAAARRSLRAGFDVVELHAAHGYLVHQFLSPLANHRTDEYGGTLENRARLLVEVVDAVRGAWPEDRPLFVRFSATDWTEGGLTADEVALVAKRLVGHGVDLADVSTGGVAPAEIPVGPGYQVPFARQVREQAALPTAAVGLVTDPLQAEQLLVDGAADAVLLGRVALREPAWPQRAAHELGVERVRAGYPDQYARGAWR